MAFRLEHRVPPPLVGLVTGGIMYAVSRLLPAFAFDLPHRYAAAAGVAMIGAAIDLAALVAFHKARTTVNPLSPGKASRLVTGGIYRWTRNPMYLGMAVFLLAWGLWLANVAALAVIFAFVAYLNRFQIAPEERALEAKFGSEFAAYRARVRRWL